MWPDQVSNPGPLTYESGDLLTALRGLALTCSKSVTAKYTSTTKRQYYGEWVHSHGK